MSFQEVVFLKILLYSHEFPPFAGGAGIYTADLASGLSDLGVEVVVLAPKYKNDAQWDREQKYRIIRTPGVLHGKLRIIKRIYYLLKTIIKEKPTVIHSTNSSAHKISAIAHFLYPQKILITVHGSEIYNFFPNNKPYDVLTHFIKLYFRKAKCVICVSNSTKNLLLSRIKKRESFNIEVVYNGIRTDKFIVPSKAKKEEKKIELKAKGPIILSVSRLDEDKGNDKVIEALPRIKEKYPEVIYIVIGEGEAKQKLDTLIKALGLRENVSLVGNVDQKDLSIYYDLADVFVLPSRRGEKESFGLIYVESYLFKTPVVGTNHGGVPEVIEDGVSGFTVDPYDVDQIANKTIELLDNPEKAFTMAEKGYQLSMNKFNVVNMAQKTLDLYY